jgi:hypothetical protein
VRCDVINRECADDSLRAPDLCVLGTQLARPFAFEGVAAAPPARSAMRFCGRSPIHDVEGWRDGRWPGVGAALTAITTAV